MKTLYLALILMLLFQTKLKAQESNTMNKKVLKTEDEWKAILSPNQY